MSTKPTIERSFAHLYDTGGMRRTHLRGHTNILKRLLIHAGAFNLGLIMRQLIGVGTPRGLQGRRVAVIGACWAAMVAIRVRSAARACAHRRIVAVGASLQVLLTLVVKPPKIRTSTTGC